MNVKRIIRPLPWLFSVLLAGAVQASTELELAAKAGRLDEVQALLEAGGGVDGGGGGGGGGDVKGGEGAGVGGPPRRLVAVRGGPLGGVRHLLAKGADPA